MKRTGFGFIIKFKLSRRVKKFKNCKTIMTVNKFSATCENRSQWIGLQRLTFCKYLIIFITYWIGYKLLWGWHFYDGRAILTFNYRVLHWSKYRAIYPVCVPVCPDNIIFEQNDLWPTYMACWFRSSSKVKVTGWKMFFFTVMDARYEVTYTFGIATRQHQTCTQVTQHLTQSMPPRAK